MSIHKKNSGKTVLRQGSLPNMLEGSLDVRLNFRDNLSKAFSALPESRWQSAARVSELTRRSISKDMLDKYCSNNFDYALRAEDLPAVIAVTHSLAPVEALLSPLGHSVMTPEDQKLLRLAHLKRKKDNITTEIATLRAELGIAPGEEI